MNHNAKRWIQLGLCTLILASAGCQNNEMHQTGKDDSADHGTREMNEISVHTVPADISADQQINDAITDLAARIGVTKDAVAVKQARSVQWGSGAMGCPKPGMNYTQALVPGMQLLLEVNGTIYHYHGGAGKRLFLCPSERVKAPAYGQGLEVM